MTTTTSNYVWYTTRKPERPFSLRLYLLIVFALSWPLPNRLRTVGQ